MPNKIISIENVSKVYKTGDTTTIALSESTLHFNTKELTLILGPSGSGKTTLLSLLGCVIYPSTGKITINNQDITKFSENKLAKVRLNTIGFVFQGFNLIEPLTALENVIAPLLLKGTSYQKAKKKALEALKQVNMEDRMGHLPKMLSGGQKQRVAIARALVTEPQILLCDEPTASIDAKTAHKIMSELKELSKMDKVVIVVTHDTRLKRYADRIVYLSEGKTSEQAFEDHEFEL